MIRPIPLLAALLVLVVAFALGSEAGIALGLAIILLTLIHGSLQ